MRATSALTTLAVAIVLTGVTPGAAGADMKHPTCADLYPQQACLHDPSDPPCLFRVVATSAFQSDYQCAKSPQQGDASCDIESTLVSRLSLRAGRCERAIVGG